MSRKRRKKQDSGGGGAPDWITTYSDLVTLLLCFFILLFSFSSIDAAKFRSIMSSFQGGTGILDGSEKLDFPDVSMDNPQATEEEGIDELREDLEEYLDDVDLGANMTIRLEERGVVIRFMDNVFFNSGSAEIRPGSKKVVSAVAKILNKDEFKNKQVKIEGHTDSDPIVYSEKYPSNWELSSSRATNVLRYLLEVEKLDPKRISASAYSHHRPIVNNDTKENKAKNRRVDVVILKEEYEELEP